MKSLTLLITGLFNTSISAYFFGLAPYQTSKLRESKMPRHQITVNPHPRQKHVDFTNTELLGCGVGVG
jgi:hypothetical protein